MFLLASGWRSGSTLLQRLVMSSGEVFVWGEPYARGDHVRRIASSLLPISDTWPRENDLYGTDRRSDDIGDDWIANLTPTPGTLVTAHRAFYRTLMHPPREDIAWGMNEVRLDATHAGYLRLLSSSARFVFLIRNPYEQWRSYRHWGSWHDRWPRTVRSPEEFGAMWARLAASFVDDARRLGAYLVRYEDLIGDRAASRKLGEHLAVPIAQAPSTSGSRAGARAGAAAVRATRQATGPLRGADG